MAAMMTVILYFLKISLVLVAIMTVIIIETLIAVHCVVSFATMMTLVTTMSSPCRLFPTGEDTLTGIYRPGSVLLLLMLLPSVLTQSVGRRSRKWGEFPN